MPTQAPVWAAGETSQRLSAGHPLLHTGSQTALENGGWQRPAGASLSTAAGPASASSSRRSAGAASPGGSTSAAASGAGGASEGPPQRQARAISRRTRPPARIPSEPQAEVDAATHDPPRAREPRPAGVVGLQSLAARQRLTAHHGVVGHLVAHQGWVRSGGRQLLGLLRQQAVRLQLQAHARRAAQQREPVVPAGGGAQAIVV